MYAQACRYALSMFSALWLFASGNPLNAIGSDDNPLAIDGFRCVVKVDERAYRFALEEAKILARAGKVWHPMGVAPSCKFAGTGRSMSKFRPVHCFFNSGRKLVARARVYANGRWYWSSQYK